MFLQARASVFRRPYGFGKPAASDQPGAQQRRNAQQPGAGRLHPSPGRDPRQHLREPATSASGLNLLVTAIILWNTRYLERPIAALRQAEDVPDQLLAHLSPLGWEHVNLTGDYIWSAERPAVENSDRFRPLRAAPDPTASLRLQTSQELNKGETRNSLARAVFIHRPGEIRDSTYENQQHPLPG
jgi:Tn3 transposase DDE domain